ENLDDAFDLVAATNDRIEFALTRELREVPSVRIERRRLALAFRRRRLSFGSEQRRGLYANLRRIDAEVREDARRYAFTLGDEAEQQMLRSDVVVIELAGFFEGELDDALSARGEDHFLLDGLTATSHDRFNFLAYFRKVHAERLEDFGRQTLAFGNDPEQNVL